MAESSSSPSYQLHLNSRFFTRIRRFLYHKTSSGNRYGPSDHPVSQQIIDVGERLDRTVVVKSESVVNDNDDEDDIILQRSVKKLHFGICEEKEAAAREIKRLAGDDLRRRKLLAELGVIPPLVAMVGSGTAARRRLAVQALLELANGTCTNKALMIKAGILSKLSENVDAFDESGNNEIAQLLMSLSSLVNVQINIDSSKVLPILLHILESDPNIDTQMSCLATLYNLSTMLDNVANLATNEVVNNLVRLLSVRDASEKALATLENLVVTLIGKKLIENNPMVPESLIEVLTWDDERKSQELSSYVLMILAHQSSLQREKMVKAGIVPILLEVALLGSPLAQKRALKLLQWFRDERQMKMGPHSGPQIRRLLSTESYVTDLEETGEGKKMMKNMVNQSLYKNLETITRRANGCVQDPNSKLKLLVVSSSSKSLPY